MRHPEYYTWKFQTLLIVPPTLALCLYHLLFGAPVIQAWDFTGDAPSLHDWQFPVPYTTIGKEGAVFSLAAGGPLALIDGLALPADRIGEVRIRLRATDAATGRDAWPMLWLHWAHIVDAAPMKTQSAPVFVSQGCPFEMAFERDHGCVYRARPTVENLDRWKGVVQALRIFLVLPQTSVQGYRIELAKIEILE